jgi:hypothetical protein
MSSHCVHIVRYTTKYLDDVAVVLMVDSLKMEGQMLW